MYTYIIIINIYILYYYIERISFICIYTLVIIPALGLIFHYIMQLIILYCLTKSWLINKRVTFSPLSSCMCTPVIVYSHVIFTPGKGVTYLGTTHLLMITHTCIVCNLACNSFCNVIMKTHYYAYHVVLVCSKLLKLLKITFHIPLVVYLERYCGRLHVPINDNICNGLQFLCSIFSCLIIRLYIIYLINGHVCLDNHHTHVTSASILQRGALLNLQISGPLSFIFLGHLKTYLSVIKYHYHVYIYLVWSFGK